MTVIQGFAARLECMLNTCVRHASTVSFSRWNFRQRFLKILTNLGKDNCDNFACHKTLNITI